MLTLALALVAAPTVACKRTPDARTDPSAAPSASAPSPTSSARALALAPPVGMSKVDQQIVQRQTMLQRAPNTTAEWIILGELWVRKAREAADPGFYLNAQACADVALSIEPSNRLALDLRAMVLLNDHKFEEARKLSQSILADHPDDPTALGNLSDALLELGRFEEAATAVQTMIDLKPNLPSYSRASYIRWLQGDQAAAILIVRQAMDSGRDSHDPEPLAWVTVQAAMLFWHVGDYPGADAGFDRALALFKDYPPALVGKARVALTRNDGKQAADLLTRAYAQSPLVETAWLLGDARTLAGDEAGAKQAYADVEKHGKLGDGRTLAAYWTTKNVNAPAALALMDHERTIRGDLYTDDAYAWALYRNGRFPEAKTAIDHALRLGTRDAKLLYHSGAIRIALGDKAAGEKIVRDALALNPQFEVTGAAEAAKLVGAPAGKSSAP
ncbi:MAG: hypothetical protein NVSMB47_02220 [Polyangiales bacterium]